MALVIDFLPVDSPEGVGFIVRGRVIRSHFDGSMDAVDIEWPYRLRWVPSMDHVIRVFEGDDADSR